MSKLPNKLPNDLFGRQSRLPDGFTREERIAMLGEVFEALRDGRPVPRAAAAFVGSAGSSWMENGGDFLRDYLKITLRHSHNTPQVVWRRLKRQRHQ